MVMSHLIVSVDLRDLLESYARGEVALDEVLRQIRLVSYRSVGEMAKIDHHRADRTGIPEAILAEGKEEADLARIALTQLDAAGLALITRVTDPQLQVLRELDLPHGAGFRWEERARMVVLSSKKVQRSGGKVGVLSAGTADIPVAEEARVTAEVMGCEVVTEYDLGVAGIHRLFPSLEKVMDADALVIAAGREGTLPTVVAGLVEVPVIGLPVSTGYGAGGEGQAALLSMLQSCSVMAVVNIDAGFVAGAFAANVAGNCASKSALRSDLL